MDVIITKIVVAILFGILRFLCGLLPIRLYNWLREWEDGDSDTFINRKRHDQIVCGIVLCQSFGGGVLMATCFLHMMTKLFTSVEEIKKFMHFKTDYPLSQLAITIGFFIVYFLEELSHWIIGKKQDTKAFEKIASSISKEITNTKTPEKHFPNKIVSFRKEFSSKDNNLNQFNSKDKKPNENDSGIEGDLNTNIKRKYNGGSMKNRHKDIERITSIHSENIEEIQKYSEEETAKIKNQDQLMRCILTIVAISFHSMLEGLSIGLRKRRAEVWYLFIAVSIHSASILFWVGLELFLAKTKIRFIILKMGILSISSPIGVLFGLLLFNLFKIYESPVNSIVAIILEGMSAGTILYITFFQVLNREKERRVYRLKRGLCIVGGFVLMATLQYVEIIMNEYYASATDL